MLYQTRTTGRKIRSSLLAALLGVLATTALAETEDPAFDYSAVGLRTAVWVDKPADEIYRKGEFQTVGFQSSEDAYAVVYRIDTEGEVTVLWPRSRMDDGFVFGGHEYAFPVSGDRKLRVATSEGEGYVEAIVSRYPFDLRDLELDFHHEPGVEKAGFRVAGDPFLAMNEVNFAITGLEDAGDYVVTNYVSYYVHQEVEHPRYLCNQCHFDDDTAYHPYRDSCQLEITVDYRWGNTWWDSYGYYPVYASPVYVYTDPWLWRPWVNFWYDPWWRCPPVRGVYWSSNVYVWHDSDWYGGNCNIRYRDGHRRYRPLTPYDQQRTKVREYGATAPMLAGTKTTKSGSRSRAYEGVKKTRRENPAIARTVRDRGNGGLRIRDSYGRTSASAGVRHSAGGTRTAAGVKSTKRGDTGRRAVAPVRSGGSDRLDASRSRNGGNLRTVEPRNKGTRVWSADRGTSSQQRQNRSEQVRPGGARRSGGRDATSTTRARGNRSGTSRKSDAVRSGGGSRSGGSRDSGKATVRGKGGSSSRSGGKSAVRNKSGGGSRKSGKSTVRDKSSGGRGGSSKSSGSRSGGGRDTSTKSSSSRSSGSAASSGSSGASRGGRSGGSSSRSSGSRGGGRR